MKGMCGRVRRKGRKRWANKSQRREGVKRGESAREKEILFPRRKLGHNAAAFLRFTGIRLHRPQGVFTIIRQTSQFKHLQLPGSELQ